MYIIIYIEDIIHAQIIPNYYCYLILFGSNFDIYTYSLEPLEKSSVFKDKMFSEQLSIIEKMCKLLKYNLKATN